MRLAWMSVALLLLVVPAAAAEGTVTEIFSSDFTTVTTMVEGEVTGRQAQGARRSIDNAGDANGVVTAADVQAYIAKVAAHIAEPSWRQATMDGSLPADVDSSAQIEGAEGPVTSDAPFTITATTVATYVPGAGPGHTYRLTFWRASDPDTAVPTSITLRSPTGYLIGDFSGLPGEPEASADRGQLHFTDDHTYDGKAIVTFEPDLAPASPKAGGALPTLPMLLVALAGMAAARSRRI